MRPETASGLADARLACERITEAVANVDGATYQEDWRTQSVVERQFTIIGEALVRVRDFEPPIFARLSNVQRIIAFRNFLVHAYDAVDASRVFKIAITDVPVLLSELDGLLAEADAQGL